MNISELHQKTQKTLTAIRNFPIPIEYETDISEVYTSERKKLRTEKQLKAFTRRWNSVWKIPWFRNWKMSDSEKQIVSGKYNAKNVMRCIEKNDSDGDGCAHVQRNKRCVTADILAPAFLIQMLRIGNHFEVSDGVALVQLIRVLHKDLTDQDPSEIFNYIYPRPKKVKTTLPCGCHCEGGCGDPYTACMYPCKDHIPY